MKEAYGFGTGYMNEHGYSYKNISRRNKGYNQWKYPWINPGNGTFQTDPVYNWVYTGDSFGESDVSIGEDWLFLNTISASNDDFIQEGEDIVASSDVYYPEGLYSYDKTYIQFLSAEGVGLLGGWSNVKGSARVYSGSDGKYYVNVSATAYTPASRIGDVTFYGTVDVLSGNKVLSSSKLHPFSGPSIIQTGRQDIGSAVITLPGLSDNEVYLRFNVGYSYTEGAGFVSPIPCQGHYRIKVGYIIDAWTH